jgi:Fe-S-cluster containining protein
MASEVKNPCAAMGCSACCRDMTFDYASDKTRRTLTPPGTTVVEVAEEKELKSEAARVKRRSADDTIVFVHRRYNGIGINTIKIVGPCPNLQNDGSCGVYVNRPASCEKFQFNGGECFNMRKPSKPGGEVFFPTIQRRPGMAN